MCAKAAAWPAGGTGKSVGWARYTSHDPSLLTWTLASEPFVRQRDGKPAYLGSCSGAYFQKLPGGVEPYTHIIQSGCDGSSFFLGTYNHTTEVLTLASDRQDIVVDDIGAFSQKDAYLLRQIFLLILSPFRSTDLFGGAGTSNSRAATIHVLPMEKPPSCNGCGPASLT